MRPGKEEQVVASNTDDPWRDTTSVRWIEETKTQANPSLIVSNTDEGLRVGEREREIRVMTVSSCSASHRVSASVTVTAGTNKKFYKVFFVCTLLVFSLHRLPHQASSPPSLSSIDLLPSLTCMVIFVIYIMRTHL